MFHSSSFCSHQKITEKKQLSSREKSEWLKVKERYNIVCKAAFDKNVPLLIDAEESWMQTAADHLIEDLMEIYNKKKTIIFNTLQMYRHDRMDYLKTLHQKAQQKGFYIGKIAFDNGIRESFKLVKE